MQPTASRAALLLQCAYPFRNPKLVIAQESSPEAEYGTRFHDFMARAIWSREAPSCPEDEKLGQHVKKSYEKLDDWLLSNGWWSNDQWEGKLCVEYSMAYRPEMGTARQCCPPGGAHFYPDLRDDEIGGTADLLIVPEDRSRPLLVLDHKTGLFGDFSRPDKLPQLMVLGMMAACLFERQKFVLAVLHSPKDGVPVIYSSDEIDLSDEPVRRMHVALREQMRRIGDGSLRPGDECRFCPARDECPAQVKNLVQRCGELVEKASLVGSELVLVSNDNKLSREERLGRLHLLMSRFRELDKRATAEIKRELVENPDLEIIRPDGKQLKLVHKSVETLSKASIIRALGKVEGEKLIAKLRGMGCVESDDRVELHAY